MAADVTNWLSKADAASFLKISIRALERKIEAKEVETAPRPRDGKRPETVCNPQDIERLMAKPAHVMPADSSTAIATRPPEKYGRAVALEVMAAVAAMRGIQLQSERRWLTLPESAERSGITKRSLQLAIKDEQHRAALGAWKDGRSWKIDRVKLDSYTPSELPPLVRSSRTQGAKESQP